jgi:hypothetical protein
MNIQMLSHYFPTHEIIIDYSYDHKVIKVSAMEWLDAPIRNWKYNRKPDEKRCIEIAEHQLTHYVEDMFFVAYNKSTNTFDIIDGSHRDGALRMNHRLLNEGVDVVALQGNLIVNIRLNASEGQLVDLFQTLNKSISVPRLYVQNSPEEEQKQALEQKKDIIERTVYEIQRMFSDHFSPSGRPNRPNTNRDLFINQVEQWYMARLEEHNDSKDTLVEFIMEENQRYKQKAPTLKLSDSIKKKCEKTGCWLFIS